MADLEELESLLRKLREVYEEADTKSVQLKHFLRKVADGEKELSEEKRTTCTQLLTKTKKTVHDLFRCLHTLTEIIEDGCDKLKATESAELQSLPSLQLPSFDDNLLQLRVPTTRVSTGSTDSAIGLVDSKSSSLLDPEEHRDSIASSRQSENVDNTLLEEEEPLNDLSRDSGAQGPVLPDFHNLSVTSIQSNSVNIDPVEEALLEAAKDPKIWDPKIGPVPEHQPERDSVAFANFIEPKDKNLMAAQAKAVHGAQRHANRNDENNVLVIKDDYYDDKDCDV